MFGKHYLKRYHGWELKAHFDNAFTVVQDNVESRDDLTKIVSEHMQKPLSTDGLLWRVALV